MWALRTSRKILDGAKKITHLNCKWALAESSSRLPFLKQGVPKCKTITGALNLFFFLPFVSFLFYFLFPSSSHLCAENLKHAECFWSERWVETMHLSLSFSCCSCRNRPLFVSCNIIRRMLWFFFILFLQPTLTTVGRCCAHYRHTLGCRVFPVPQGKTAVIC